MDDRFEDPSRQGRAVWDFVEVSKGIRPSRIDSATSLVIRMDLGSVAQSSGPTGDVDGRGNTKNTRRGKSETSAWVVQNVGTGLRSSV